MGIGVRGGLVDVGRYRDTGFRGLGYGIRLWGLGSGEENCVYRFVWPELPVLWIDTESCEGGSCLLVVGFDLEKLLKGFDV